jgi:hypothetical protein
MTHAVTIDERSPGRTPGHQRQAAPGQLGLNNPTDTFLPESVPDTGPDNSFQHMGSFTIRSTCGATLARALARRVSGLQLAAWVQSANGMLLVLAAESTPGIV